MLNRISGELDDLIRRELETELVDYETQKPTGILIKLKVGEVKANTRVELHSEENARYFIVSHQLVSNILHTGIFNDKYDSKHCLCVTDGIMPQGMGWPLPKIHNKN